MVVVYHFKPNWLSAGYLGVDIFLVISGYLVIPKISRITEKPKAQQELLDYFKSRTRRIIPPLSATIILFSVPMLFFADLQSLDRIIKQMLASLFGVGNLGAYLFSGNYFSSEPNPFVHTWSLAVEMQFYVLMPLVLILAKSILGEKLKIVTLLFIIGLISLTLFFWSEPLYWVQSLFGINDHSTFFYFDIVPRLWEFAIGGIVALSPNVSERLLKKTSRLSLPMSLLSLVLAVCVFSSASFSQFFVIPTVNLLTVLALIKAKYFIIDRTCGWLTLKYVGDVSYSLYLVHMPTLYLAHQIARGFDLPHTVSLTTGFIVSFILAGCIFRLVETPPINLYKNTLLSPSMKRTSTLWLTALISLSTVSYIYLSNNHIAKRLELSREYAGWADPNCQRDSFSGPPCIYGSAEDPEVLLLGDSRAGMISTSVVQISALKGYSSTIWTHSGCRFNLYFDTRKTSNCDTNSTKALDYIRENSPEYVVISQSITSTESISELINSILEIERTGSKVLVVGPIPVIADSDFNETGSLLVPGKTSRTNILIQDLDLESSLLRSKYLSKLRANSIASIDPYKALCDFEYCYVRRAGEEWYRDNNHLTPAGARQIEILLSDHISTSIKSSI
jgi:peptidoglycan/LPS O-acetylase OafA/YrhL